MLSLLRLTIKLGLHITGACLITTVLTTPTPVSSGESMLIIASYTMILIGVNEHLNKLLGGSDEN